MNNPEPLHSAARVLAAAVGLFVLVCVGVGVFTGAVRIEIQLIEFLARKNAP